MRGDRADLLDRAAGCLWGLAIGDALGMPTQLLTRRQVLQTFGEITGFEAATPDHPIASGLAAGTVTDDTEQAILLAAMLLPGGHVDQQAWANALLAWEQDVRARGSLDLLGPSTKGALAELMAGAPLTEAGRHGTTNGAAMRIAPVGIAVDSSDLERLVDRVVEASMLTHNTSLGLAGAAAVAAAISSCLDGCSYPEAVGVAVHAAEIAATRGHQVKGDTVDWRMEWANEEAAALDEVDVAGFVVNLVGTSLAALESVPAAFALLAAYQHEPWTMMCAAASLGGDSDTIAAMAGAVAGAAYGLHSLPGDAVQVVRQVNGLDMDAVAARLVDLRCR